MAWSAPRRGSRPAPTVPQSPPTTHTGPGPPTLRVRAKRPASRTGVRGSTWAAGSGRWVPRECCPPLRLPGKWRCMLLSQHRTLRGCSGRARRPRVTQQAGHDGLPVAVLLPDGSGWSPDLGGGLATVPHLMLRLQPSWVGGEGQPPVPQGTGQGAGVTGPVPHRSLPGDGSPASPPPPGQPGPAPAATTSIFHPRQ